MASGLDLSALTDFINEQKHAQDIYTRAINKNDSSPWLVQLGMNKHKMALPNVDSDRGNIQDGSVELGTSDFKGQVIASQTVLVGESLAYFTKMQARDLENFYTNVSLPAGQDYQPEALSALDSAILNKIIATISGDLERLIWRGDKAGATSTFLDLADGFNVQAEAAVTGAVLSKTSSGVITQGNARDVVDGLVDAAMANDDFAPLMSEAGKTYILTGHDVVRAYAQQYRGDFGALPYNTSFNKPLVDGTEVMLIGVSGLTGENTAYLTRSDNFVQGHDVIGEERSMQVDLDQFKEFIWLKDRFKHGVIARDMSDNSVFYHAATA